VILDYYHRLHDSARLEGIDFITRPVAACERAAYDLRKKLLAHESGRCRPLFNQGQLNEAEAVRLLESGFTIVAETYEMDSFYLNDLAALEAIGGDRVIALRPDLPVGDTAAQEALIDLFAQAHIDPYLTGSAPVLDNTLLIRLPNIRARQLVNTMTIEGISITNGEGCSLSLSKPSFVLQSYGYSEEEAREAISLSWEPDTAIEELIAAAEKLIFRYRQVERLGR
jgi:hypothetical protein